MTQLLVASEEKDSSSGPGGSEGFSSGRVGTVFRKKEGRKRGKKGER